MLLRWRVDLEDRFEYHHRCRHHHAIRNSRNSEWPKLISCLRNPDPSHRLSSIRLRAEYVRQFVEPSLLPVRLDVRKFLPIYPRRAFISFAPLIGVSQYIFAIQLVVQQIESIVRLLSWEFPTGPTADPQWMKLLLA